MILPCRPVKIERWIHASPAASLALAFLLLALPSCNRSDPRRQASIDALLWSSSNPNDVRVRDLLRDALQKSTTASLAKPQLVAATAIIPTQKPGSLSIDWIGASPDSDAVRILLSNGQTADFPFDPLDNDNNQQTSAKLLIYHATIFAQRNQPAIWKQILADPAAKAALLQKSKIVSNQVPLVSVKLPPPATHPASAKLIGTRDAAGKLSQYLLSHDVKAGDHFALSDVYAVPLSLDPALPAGSLLDLAGPPAFVGRTFLKNAPANTPLDDSLFPHAATTNSMQ